MKRERSILLCLVMLVSVLWTNQAIARDGVEITFDQALREDKLTIVPMDESTFDDGEWPLSLSPDGEKLLLLEDGGLSVYSLAYGTRTLLTPRAGDSHLTEERIRNLFAAPEATAVSWSADGRYLSFSFPRHVYMQMFAGSNLWIADLDTGMIDPLFDLPDDVSMPYDADASSIPVRAVFDLNSPALYYDMIAVDEADKDAPIKTRYFKWNYETDETVPVGYTASYMASSDPKLWRIADRLVTTNTYIGSSNRRAGLTTFTDEGISHLQWEDAGFLAAFLDNAYLIDAQGSDAVLYQRGSGNERVYDRNRSMSDRQIIRLMECTLSDQGQPQYGAFLAMDANAPASTRLLHFSSKELDDEETDLALFNRYLHFEILVCFNAAFSPDGGYLLLATQGFGGQPKGLYVLNRATGECGRIALPEDFETGMNGLPFIYDAGPNRLPGIQWAAGNRLLLFDGKMNRFCTLTIQP